MVPLFIGALVLIVMAAFSLRAGLVTDLFLNGDTNAYVATASTNVMRATSTNTVFDLSKEQIVSIQAEFQCTNSSKMKAGDGPTITFDACVNGSQSDHWLTNYLSFVVPTGGGSNLFGVTLTNLTAAQCYPVVRLGEIWNTNVSGTNFNNVKVRVWTYPLR